MACTGTIVFVSVRRCHYIEIICIYILLNHYFSNTIHNSNVCQSVEGHLQGVQIQQHVLTKESSIAKFSFACSVYRVMWQLLIGSRKNEFCCIWMKINEFKLLIFFWWGREVGRTLQKVMCLSWVLWFSVIWSGCIFLSNTGLEYCYLWSIGGAGENQVWCSVLYTRFLTVVQTFSFYYFCVSVIKLMC